MLATGTPAEALGAARTLAELPPRDGSAAAARCATGVHPRPRAAKAAAASGRPVVRCPRPPRRRRWPRRHRRRRRGCRRVALESLHDGKVDGEVAGAARALAGVAGGCGAGSASSRGPLDGAALVEAVDPLVALIKSSADPDEVGAAAAAVAAISAAHLPAAQAAARAGIAPSLARRLDGAAAVDCASALGALVEVGGIGSREMHAAGGLLKLVAMLQPTAGADATATAGLQIDTKLRAGGAQQRDVFRELRGIKLLGTALAVGASAATPAAPKTLLSLIAALDAAVVGHRTNQRAASPPAPSPRSLLSRAASPSAARRRSPSCSPTRCSRSAR